MEISDFGENQELNKRLWGSFQGIPFSRKYAEDIGRLAVFTPSKDH